MKSELRLDRMTAGKLKRLDNGFIRFPITATRAGIFVYKGADGSEWRELRPPDEVFHVDSMQSLSAVPVTNDHPTELLNAKNTKDHMVGYTSDRVDRKDIFLKTSATVTDHKAIEALMSGKQQVSCGYLCDVEEKKGMWNGQRYDAIQRNIRYNHVAIVAAGRAGEEVRVHFDSAEKIEQVMRLDSFIDVEENPKKGVSMKVIVVDGNEYQVSEEAHAAISKKFSRDSASVTELRASVDAEKAEASKASARADGLKDEVEALKKQTPKFDSAQVTEAVKKRVALERFAAKRLDSDLTPMTDREIIEALIKLDNKDFKAEGKDDIYLEARLDHMIDNFKEDKKGDKKTGGTHSQAKNISKERETNDSEDKDVPTYDSARVAAQERDAGRWQKRIGYGAK